MITVELTIEDYLASKRVSHHKLRTLATKGARAYKIAHEQKAHTEEDTKHYLAGRAIEDCLQRPSDFTTKYVVKPDGMSFATKEGKAWKAEQLASGKEILDGGDAKACQQLIETLQVCDTARALIAGATQQVTVLHDAIPGFPALPGVQSRPDWLSLNGCAASEWRPYSLDLKSTRSLALLSNYKQVMRHGYHRQAAITRICLELEGIDTSGFQWLLLAAEKAFPYRWGVRAMPPALVEDGYRWCMRHMHALERYYATDEWPLVESEVLMIEAPEWLEPVDEEEGEAA